MGILEIIVIGLGLSMDAFAVTIADAASVATARSADGQTKKQPLLLAAPFIFGLFQGIMPLLGYFAVTTVFFWMQNTSLATAATSFLPIDTQLILGLVSAIILWVVGGKMLLVAINALRHPDESMLRDTPNIGLATLAVQGVATSLDALLVGVSLTTSTINIGFAAMLIALTTFVCCFGALALGRCFGILLGERAQVFGGIVLILIGAKALFFS